MFGTQYGENYDSQSEKQKSLSYILYSPTHVYPSKYQQLKWAYYERKGIKSFPSLEYDAPYCPSDP